MEWDEYQDLLGAAKGDVRAGLERLWEMTRRLDADKRRLENDLANAQARRTADMLEEMRQHRIDETARRIWADRSSRYDEYTATHVLADSAYYTANKLEEARERYIRARVDAKKKAEEDALEALRERGR